MEGKGCKCKNPQDKKCGGDCCTTDEKCCAGKVCCGKEETCCGDKCCAEDETCCGGECCKTGTWCFYKTEPKIEPSDEELDWKALARNGALAGPAALVIAGGGGPSAVAWLGELDGGTWGLLGLGAGLVAAAAAGAWAFASLLRSYGRVLVRLDRLERVLADVGIALEGDEEIPEIGRAPGTPAPAFSLRGIDGRTVTLEGLLDGGLPALLLFSSPTCGPCTALMPTVAAWQREHAEEFTIALVAAGDAATISAEAAEHGLENVLLDEGLVVYEAYEANGTPSGVLLAPDGTIASWVASGSEWVERLVERQLESGVEAEEEGLPVGEPAPDLELPDLEGRTVALRDLRGEETVVLFWNPGCGFCRSLHEDLLDWERRRNGGSPRLLVVSSGSAAETAAEGFASTVVLDAGFGAGEAFRAGGTPMAVRVDPEGRVGSPLAAGAPAVLDLLAARPHARSAQ